jgi:nucleoside triphosphate pyrophosphatase
MSKPQLILASASPRRRDLLDQLGVSYQVDPADIDETPEAHEAATDYVERMAREKAASVAKRHDRLNCVILAADTTVVIDQDILGKPVDHFDGLGILARLSGRRHSVITAICLQTPQSVEVRQVETGVNFVQLDRAVCEAYLATSEPWDKAGAYAIQGLAGAFVSSIEGSYSNVVGLPLTETWQLLKASGIATALESEHE